MPSRAGGYDFAADPDQGWRTAEVFWLISRAVHVVVLGPSAVAGVGAPTLAEIAATASARREAADGVHLLLPAGVQLLVMSNDLDRPLAAHVPVAVPRSRLAALAAFERTRRRLPPRQASAQARNTLARHALRLRALDGASDSASYREIAAELFGESRVPSGAAWKTSDLRSRTIRLVADGRALMRGGYTKLLT